MRHKTCLWMATLFFVAAAPARGQGPAPDVIYHNAKIFTGAAQPGPAQGSPNTFPQALAIRDGRILAVGSNDAIRRLAAVGTRLVDLGGRTVLPGFYDNHIHLGEVLQEWQGGMIGEVPDWLKGSDRLESLLTALKRHAAATPQGGWIRGEIAREDWPNQKVPTRSDLDEAAPNHPVALARGPHTLLLNSMALARAGITKDTPNPPGGWIFRNQNGEPNGRVLEAARRLVTRVMPRDARRATDDEVLATYRRQLEQLAGIGITSVNVASVRPDDFRLIQDLYDRWGPELPRATLQLRLSPGHDTYDDPEEGVRQSIAELDALGVRTGLGNDRLKIGAVKMSIDGGLSAPVFWSLKPYKGRPDFFGAQRIPDDVFYRVAKRAHDRGWQLGIHTMGDAAVVMVVNEIEKILGERPRNDHRHYLHHVAVKPPDATLDKMAKLGIMVALQPGFTVGLGAYAEEALDPDREATQNPARSLLDRGIRMSFGSDGGPYGPILGIYAAVTRRGWDGRARGSAEAISLNEAIGLHTLGSAYQTFDEKSRGTLEAGKLADLIVLAQDIFSVDPTRLREVRVERTIVGGSEIFSSGRPTSNENGARR